MYFIPRKNLVTNPKSRDYKLVNASHSVSVATAQHIQSEYSVEIWREARTKFVCRVRARPVQPPRQRSALERTIPQSIRRCGDSRSRLNSPTSRAAACTWSSWTGTWRGAPSPLSLLPTAQPACTSAPAAATSAAAKKPPRSARLPSTPSPWPPACDATSSAPTPAPSLPSETSNTGAQVSCAVAAESRLRAGADPLAGLSGAMQRILTEYRLNLGRPANKA